MDSEDTRRKIVDNPITLLVQTICGVPPGLSVNLKNGTPSIQIQNIPNPSLFINVLCCFGSLDCLRNVQNVI
jgi:hypothetical protein